MSKNIAPKENDTEDKETKVTKPVAAPVTPESAYAKAKVALEHVHDGFGDPAFALTEEELKAMLKMDGKDGHEFRKDRKQIHTLYRTYYGDKHTIYIPFAPGESVVEEHGQELWPHAYFYVNGVQFKIRKMTQVSVPKFILDLFESSFDIARYRVPVIETEHGPSSPMSPTQKSAFSVFIK